jgi:hypothetical protein
VAQIHTQKYCQLCGRPTLHGREFFSDGWGCLLTILTVGLFLPIWILLAVCQRILHKWRCTTCGTAYSSGRYF